MLKLATLSIIIAVITLCHGLSADENIILDACAASSNWTFVKGEEFPGATGSLRNVGQSMRLTYDFSQGGSYVAAIYRGTIPETVETVTFDLQLLQSTSLALRLKDSTGKMFQTRSQTLPAGRQSISMNLPGEPWHSTWGGDKQAKPQAPFKEIWLNVSAASKEVVSGWVDLLALQASGESLASSNFRASPFALTVPGWSATGVWHPAVTGVFLELTLTPASDTKVAANLSVDFPLSGRDRIDRFTFQPDTTSIARVMLPAENPRNIYQLLVTLQSGDASAAQTVLVRGAKADANLLGSAKKSTDIANARFGVCVHFDYGINPQGAFKGWHDYKTLIDLAADCGMKYIRTGAQFPLDENTEKRQLRDWDLGWLQYAKERGIEIILVLGTYAKNTLEQYAELCAAAAEITADLVDVFELGNEPNNFGGWRDKYGGTWNGMEKDGSTSNWVKEFVKTTNAGAEAIKRVRPTATVIGTGACAPTNVRMLMEGLSPSLDGLVEHPYSMSLAPENFPFVAGHVKRDGIAVADEKGSISSLLQSYLDHNRQYGGRERTIWITEHGYPSYRFNGKNEKGHYVGWSEKAQAVNLLRRQLVILGHPEVKAALVYDLLDDYQSAPYNAEANFGLLRGDFSPKPAYFVLQRFNSLLASCQPESDLTVTVTAAPLHRGMLRGIQIPDWDGVAISGDNGILTQALSQPGLTNEKWLAIWSAQIYNDTYNNRAVSLELEGLTGFSPQVIGIDLVTGRSFDLKVEFDQDKAQIPLLELEEHPLLLRFMRE